jgi:hypothetical protein
LSDKKRNRVVYLGLGQNGAEEFFIVLAHWPVIDLAASACCCGILMLSIATSPNNPITATIAIIANVVSFTILSEI